MNQKIARDNLPLVAIMGPTASGKSALAVELALKHNGEIICADSRTVYRDMDIGTAKPTDRQQKLVPHHMLNLINPGERYTIYQFKNTALKIIDDIRLRGKVPFLVGGSGLYLYTVLFDYDFDAKARRRELIDDCIAVGIDVNSKILRARIRKRFQKMLDTGLIEEVERLIGKYGTDTLQLNRNLYGEVQKFLQGDISRPELIKRTEVVDWHLAKKQNTWFRQKRDKITWLPLEKAGEYISDLLSE
jgi:tRNA dimethylallyltransferase